MYSRQRKRISTRYRWSTKRIRASQNRSYFACTASTKCTISARSKDSASTGEWQSVHTRAAGNSGGQSFGFWHPDRDRMNCVADTLCCTLLQCWSLHPGGSWQGEGYNRPPPLNVFMNIGWEVRHFRQGGRTPYPWFPDKYRPGARLLLTIWGDNHPPCWTRRYTLLWRCSTVT